MLEEIFQKESFTDEDMKVIMDHYAELSDDQLVRLGFEPRNSSVSVNTKVEVAHEAPKEPEVQTDEVSPVVKRRKRATLQDN